MIEKIMDYFMLTILFSVMVILLVTFISLPFLPEETLADDVEKEQILCEHEWCEINNSIFGIKIYCPICEKEKFIENSEWNKIKAKADYEQNHAVK